jgi:hypothetical protein
MWMSPERKSTPGIQGERAVDVFKILDADGELEAVQCVFLDGSSLILIVWTDWTIRADRRTDSELPNYFWPPGESARAIVEEFHTETGAEIIEVRHHLNEVGELVGVDIVFAQKTLVVRSYSGEVKMSIQ